jgi:hypothetical protein
MRRLQRAQRRRVLTRAARRYRATPQIHIALYSRLRELVAERAGGAAGGEGGRERPGERDRAPQQLSNALLGLALLQEVGSGRRAFHVTAEPHHLLQGRGAVSGGR